MAPKEAHNSPIQRPRNGNRLLSEMDINRLLRFSHIFASTVQEILEKKLLREVSPLPLTLSQFHLLKLMSVDGQHQVGELAEYLGVSAPAATKNIDKLERFKLVVRNPSKGDRRATLLSASLKGRRLVQKYEALKATRLSPVLDVFKPREIDKFSELLERFSMSLLTIEQPGRGFCLRCAAYIAADCPVSQVSGGCPYQKVRETTSHKDTAKETS